jgi:hypothetical protein
MEYGMPDVYDESGTQIAWVSPKFETGERWRLKDKRTVDIVAIGPKSNLCEHLDSSKLEYFVHADFAEKVAGPPTNNAPPINREPLPYWKNHKTETPAVTKRSVLEATMAAVADRGLNYGKPEANFERIARLWNVHMLNRFGPSAYNGLTAADVAQMMVLMKVARLENQPKHLDSWVDIAGYAACGGEITENQ